MAGPILLFSTASTPFPEQVMLTLECLFSVGIPGMPSPKLIMLASLKMVKGNVESQGSNANSIESQRQMACRM